MSKNPRILIATGIYPPHVGGSAYYAENLYRHFKERGIKTDVAYYTTEHKLPTGIRHIFFFFKVLFKLPRYDVVLALDSFSAGLPSFLAASLLGKKKIIRVGGDFLWEQYVERSKHLIPLPNFYTDKTVTFTKKEKFIFSSIKYLFKHADLIFFNTHWQSHIIKEAYGIPEKNVGVVENVISNKRTSAEEPKEKKFVAVGRDIVLKNFTLLKEALLKAQLQDKDITFSIGEMPYEKMLREVESAYALVLPSISDVSPDFIAKAVEYGKPFIVTKHTGLSEDLLSLGLIIDPLSREDITEKILLLSVRAEWEEYRKNIMEFSRFRTWEDITEEVLGLIQKVS